MLTIPKRVLILLLGSTLGFMLAVSLYFNIIHVGSEQSYFGFLSLYNMLNSVDFRKWFTLDDLLEFTKSVSLPMNLNNDSFDWLTALNLFLNILWVPTVYLTGFLVFVLSYVVNFVVALVQAFLGYFNIPINDTYCMSCEIPLITPIL